MAFGRRFGGRSLFFSLLAGKRPSETGSTTTASATTHPLRRRDFPGRGGTAAYSGAPSPGSFWGALTSSPRPAIGRTGSFAPAAASARHGPARNGLGPIDAGRHR